MRRERIRENQQTDTGQLTVSINLAFQRVLVEGSQISCYCRAT